MGEKKKRKLVLRRVFALFNIVSSAVPFALAVIMTFLLMVSFIHMIYSDDINTDNTTTNSRDIVSMYICQFNIRAIENSVKKNYDNPTDFNIHARRCINRLEKYNFNIYATIDSVPFYITDGYEDNINTAEGIVSEDNNGYVFLDDRNTIINDSVILQNGKRLDVTLIYNSKHHDIVNEPTITILQFSSWGYISLLIFLVLAVAHLDIFLVKRITKRVLSPIEKISNATTRIGEDILDEPVVIDSNIAEMEQLAESFESMRTKLLELRKNQEESERIRKDTYSGINHDSRTAITTIKGYTQGLIDGIANTPEKRERYLHAIESSAQSLEKLMDAFSEVTHLEADRVPFKFKERDMYSLLTNWHREVVQMLEERKVRLNLQYRCDCRIFCRVDAFQMERVCDNILSNCMKYKKPENEYVDVFIDAFIDPGNDRFFIIRYRDNGIGIKEEDESRIFDVFFRADEARSNTQNGNGIGLSIVKQILIRHGGNVEAQAEPNGLGLTFKIPISKTEDI